jgi:hypothetical protein
MKTELEAWILLVNQEIIDKAALSSQFVFKDDNALVRFASKKGKSVMLLCTLHVNTAVSEEMKT